MKVPLGIFIQSPETANGKTLISAVDLGHYLKIPAGTPLDKPLREGELSVIEKLRQVINQIMRVCERDNDTAPFKKATEKLPKLTTRNFTRNLNLKEKEVVFLDVSQTPDLMPPDGLLLKKLISSYPDFYKTSKKKTKLSQLINLIEAGESVYILNDLYSPLETRKVIEYGERFTRDTIPAIKSELNAIIRAKKEEEFTDEMSTGGKVIKMDLYNYYGNLLKKSGTPVEEAFLSSDEFKSLLSGDPEVFYYPENTFDGILLYDSNPQTAYYIKKIFKLHFFHFIDEFNSIEEFYRNIETRNPLCAIISLENSIEIDNIIEAAKKLNETQMQKYNQKTNYIFIIRGKTAEIENKIRNNGFTFILDKENIISNFNQFDSMLSNIISILEQ